MTDTTWNQLPESPGAVMDLRQRVATPAEAPASAGPTRRVAAVSAVLRLAGAALVVASAATFMLRHWSEGSDEIRYLLLLGLTAVLGIAGLICALGIRDSRGGRTLLGLVISTVPVHFTVMGAMLQSRFPWDSTVAHSAPWQAASDGAALTIVGIGAGVLLPLVWVSMMTMVRAHARSLTALFFLANAPLLLPLRDPDLVAWLVAAMCLLFTLTEHRLASLGYAVRTAEGRFVRSMLAVPIGIVVGRAVLFYEPTSLFLGVALLACAPVGFMMAPRLFQRTELVQGLQAIFAGMAISGWLFIAAAIVEAVFVPRELRALLAAVPVSLILTAFSLFSERGGAGHRTIAVAISVGAATMNALVYWHAHTVTYAGMACLVIGIVTVAASVHTKRKTLLVFGVIGTLTGLVQVMIAAIEIERLGHWGALAGIGIALVLVSALIERHFERITRRLTAIRSQIAGWDY